MGQLKKRSLSVRADTSENALAAKLFRIMKEKKTNLCLAADVDSSRELIELAREIGPHICMLKVHADHYRDFYTIKDDLVNLARRLNFLLFEDAKYDDSGETVRRSYAQVIEWADIVTVQGVCTQDVIESIRQESKKIQEPRGILVVCEMSMRDNKYEIQANRDRAVTITRNNKDMVAGVIAQTLDIGDDFIKATPGVNLSARGDSLGQRWRTPESVMESGTDIVIVGRGITGAVDIDTKRARAIDYKERCFSSLVAIISS